MRSSSRRVHVYYISKKFLAEKLTGFKRSLHLLLRFGYAVIFSYKCLTDLWEKRRKSLPLISIRETVLFVSASFEL